MLNLLPVLKYAFTEASGTLNVTGLPASIPKQTATYSRIEVKTLDKRQALNRFLVSVEKRAFRMADLATGNPDHAMDIVQDAMMALAKNYSHKNEADWGPLFHRILQSKIRDWYRRSRTRNRVFGWLYTTNQDDNDDDAADPIQQAADMTTLSPDNSADNEQLMDVTLNAIRKLPLRQQQAFLLRAWEGFDVKETANAMGCSQGSVKTHYSRASKSLKQTLEAYQS
ncbi:MAG: RNA polymerase sigma factor [Gammaproteobacteria bacterium]|nr:RNA polymerase sigma factor [Gammaproteobacteria bacterium]